MSARFFVLLIVLCLSASIAQARTWRTTDERKFSGDFQGLDGNQVIIRTNNGRIEKVSYLKLSKSDRTFVKSTLTSMAKQDEVQRLIQLETTGTSGVPAQPTAPADATPGQPAKSGDDTAGTGTALADAAQMRIWTDINGKQLQARFVSANALHVTLQLLSGEENKFPIAGFRSEDQQLIRQLAEQTPATQPGVPGSSGTPGQPPVTPGFPDFPRFPGAPGIPGMSGAPAPSFPGLPGSTPGSAGFPGAGLPGPGFPGSLAPGGSFQPNAGLPNAPGMAGGPGFPGAPGAPGSQGFTGTPTLPQAPQTAGSPLGSPNPDAPSQHSPGPAPGMAPFGAAGGFGPPSQPAVGFGPPGGPPAANPGTGIPSGPGGAPMGGFETLYVCEGCGAEYTAADGVKEGDTCTRCPWYKRIRMRNVVRLLGFGAFLAIGTISFVIRKIRGS